MMLMIRINLAARAPAKGKGGKRRARASLPDVPNLGVLVFVLVLVAEFAFLHSMHASASEKFASMGAQVRKAAAELEAAKKIAAEMSGIKKEIVELERVAVVFDELEGEKRGPVGALTWLSFMLKHRDRGTTPTAELKLLEAAGWRTEWDARRAWITSMREAEGEVTIQGEALNHEDVAEFLRRLESAAHFRRVRLVTDEKRKDANLGSDFVVFQVKAQLIYLVEPYLTAEQREALKQQAAAAAPGAEGSATEAGAVLPSDRAPPTDRNASDVDAALEASATAAAADPSPPTASEAGAEAAPVPVVPEPATNGGAR